MKNCGPQRRRKKYKNSHAISKRGWFRYSAAFFICIFLFQNIGLAEVACDRGISCLKPPTTFSPDDIAKELGAVSRGEVCVSLLANIIRAQYEKGTPKQAALKGLQVYVKENSGRFESIEALPLPEDYIFRVTLHPNIGGETYMIGYEADGRPVFYKVRGLPPT